MDKERLSAALEAEASKGDRTQEEQIFIRLLRQVWQIDWTVAPYEVWCRMIGWDIPYFLRFMKMDVGDEREEEQLIREWISSRLALRKKETGGAWKDRVMNLVDYMNHLRARIRKEKGW